ncbi:MAG: adenosylcobinamide-GDP ribazoletransferase [Kiritimatiellaeota bacterium]|nr:adenosylcobinamide-GDP ribazoletransferase [Kiritimatiellota bacterium]
MSSLRTQAGRGFVTAMRTLTVLPWPGRDADEPASALPWFPLIGAIIGGFVAMIFTVFYEMLMWPSGGTALALAVSAVLTGGLHLDGLADTVDGWRGGHTREQRLAIMKDSRIGAMGAMALVLVLLLQFVALSRLGLSRPVSWIALPYILARLAQVQLAVSLPYARAGGGTAERFVTGARSGHFLAALLLAAALCYAIAEGWGLGFLLLSLVLTSGLRRWMRLAFGGITGDLLGGACVVLETVGLFLLALIGPYVTLLLYFQP